MKRILPLVASLLMLASCTRTQASTDIAFCDGAAVCAGQNPLVANVRVLQQSGARPRFSTDGQRIVFDRKNADGYYDVYLTDLQGVSPVAITDGKTAIGQKNNGNADFDPSGKYIVFISEEEEHYSDNQKWTGDPGMGLFSNFWATDLNGEHFWKLTDIPIKQSLGD